MSFKVAWWSRGVSRVPCRALTGSCSVAVRQEMDVFESFRKSAFNPLASLEVVFIGSSLRYSDLFDPRTMV